MYPNTLVFNSLSFLNEHRIFATQHLRVRTTSARIRRRMMSRHMDRPSQSRRPTVNKFTPTGGRISRATKRNGPRIGIRRINRNRQRPNRRHIRRMRRQYRRRRDRLSQLNRPNRGQNRNRQRRGPTRSFTTFQRNITMRHRTHNKRTRSRRQRRPNRRLTTLQITNGMTQRITHSRNTNNQINRTTRSRPHRIIRSIIRTNSSRRTIGRTRRRHTRTTAFRRRYTRTISTLLSQQPSMTRRRARASNNRPNSGQRGAPTTRRHRMLQRLSILRAIMRHANRRATSSPNRRTRISTHIRRLRHKSRRRVPSRPNRTYNTIIILNRPSNSTSNGSRHRINRGRLTNIVSSHSIRRVNITRTRRRPNS